MQERFPTEAILRQFALFFGIFVLTKIVRKTKHDLNPKITGLQDTSTSLQKPHILKHLLDPSSINLLAAPFTQI